MRKELPVVKDLPLSPSRTTTGFAFSILDRAIREGIARRKFGKTEKAQVLEFFDNSTPECVYCGSKDVKRWDHLVPIRNGGDTVLGNMVLACARCDDSKQHFEFEEWMTSSGRFSPQSQGVKDLQNRINKIKSYVDHFGYQPRHLDERLDSVEREKLEEIKESMGEIRAEVEELIRNHREVSGKDKIYY